MTLSGRPPCACDCNVKARKCSWSCQTSEFEGAKQVRVARSTLFSWPQAQQFPPPLCRRGLTRGLASDPPPAASLSSHACRQTSWRPIDKHKPKETGTQRTNMNGGNKNPWRAMQNSSVRKKKSPNLNLCGQDFDQPLLASRGHSETLGSTGLKFSTGAISRPAFPLG